jgi:hypothetical protein
MRIRLSVIAVAALLGCADDSTGPTAVAGTYDLVSIGGRALPTTTHVFTDGSWIAVLQGELRLDLDGTFVDQRLRRTTTGAVTSDHQQTRTGSYEVGSETITLHLPDMGGIALTGARDGRRITLAEDNNVFVYEVR